MKLRQHAHKIWMTNKITKTKINFECRNQEIYERTSKKTDTKNENICRSSYEDPAENIWSHLHCWRQCCHFWKSKRWRRRTATKKTRFRLSSLCATCWICILHTIKEIQGERNRNGPILFFCFGMRICVCVNNC